MIDDRPRSRRRRRRRAPAASARKPALPSVHRAAPSVQYSGTWDVRTSHRVGVRGEMIRRRSSGSRGQGALPGGPGQDNRMRESVGRGPRCGIGNCFECVLTVDGKPNVRTCNLPVRDGMTLRTQKSPRRSGPSRSRRSARAGSATWPRHPGFFSIEGDSGSAATGGWHPKRQVGIL